MFNFIKIQFQLGKVNEQWVRAQAPRWITREQADEIINIKGENENVI